MPHGPGALEYLLAFHWQNFSIVHPCPYIDLLLEGLVLDVRHLMTVLLWEYLTILNRLDSRVEMVLVNLTIDGSSDVLVVSRFDMFMGHGRILSLLDSRVMLAGSADKVRDCSSCLFHSEDFDIKMS